MNKIYQKTLSGGKNAGFTLIELLVVVLIIGILAAVALPQYQTAVMKARFTAMIPIAKTLADAQEVYFMENGKYADSLKDLAVAPPAGGTYSESGDSVSYSKFRCFRHGTFAIGCWGDTTGFIWQCLQRNNDATCTGADKSADRVCIVSLANKNADIIRRVCASYGGVKRSANDSFEYWTMP